MKLARASLPPLVHTPEVERELDVLPGRAARCRLTTGGWYRISFRLSPIDRKKKGEAICFYALCSLLLVDSYREHFLSLIHI